MCTAGYRSIIFDIDTDTLTSIPVPEICFFDANFIKSILTRLQGFIVQLVDVYTDSRLISSHSTKEPVQML